MRKDAATYLAWAFNRGHAVKMISKEVKLNGLELQDSDAVTEVNIDLAAEKGKVIVL